MKSTNEHENKVSFQKVDKKKERTPAACISYNGTMFCMHIYFKQYLFFLLLCNHCTVLTELCKYYVYKCMLDWQLQILWNESFAITKSLEYNNHCVHASEYTWKIYKFYWKRWNSRVHWCAISIVWQCQQRKIPNTI